MGLFLLIGLCLMNTCTSSFSVLKLNSYRVASLDFREGGDVHSNIIYYFLYQGLMRINPSNGLLQCALAKRYGVSKNGLQYTFHLKDAHWSDGSRITADDFASTWKNMLRPGSHGRSGLYLIKNACKAKKGELPIDSVGIATPDEKTLMITLEYPCHHFLEYLAYPTFFPIKESFDRNNVGWGKQGGTSYMSNGPFKVQEWQKNVLLILEKNNYYWDTQAVKIDQVVISFEEDTGLLLEKFDRGELDWLGDPLTPLPDLSIAKLKRYGKVHKMPDPSLFLYRFNVSKFPFNNKEIRQALSYAIDRKVITTTVMNRGELPATSVQPRNMLLQQEPYFTDGNVERAQELFEQGLAEEQMTCDKLPTITLLYLEKPKSTALAQLVQKQWKEVLGIHISIKPVSHWDELMARFQQSQFDIISSGWSIDYYDPVAALNGAGKYNGGWSNSAFAHIINSLSFVVSLEERKRLCHEAEKILLNEMPMIPVYYKSSYYLKNEKLKGSFISDLGAINFSNAYFSG